MIHYGDITKINGAEVPIVDIVTGGSPCQDLSVAGKRAGLAGERSGLFMEQIRVIKEMREHDRANGRTNECVRPRFMVWENVPGAFSSNHGEDFRAVLEETAKIADKDAVIPGPPKGKWTPAGCIMGDGWSIAWRVHDAQFWGVPQRRKRISLVADFAGGGAPEILFERKGVSGDITESGKEGKGTATDAEKGIRETVAVLNDQGGSVMSVSENVTGALRAQEHGHQPIVYSMAVVQGADMYNGSLTGDIAATLNATSGDSPTHSEPSVVYLEGNGSRPSHRGDGYSESETMYTLNSTEHHAVAVENHPADSRVKIAEDGKVQTLSGRMGTGGGNVPMVMESVNGEVAGTLDASYYKGCGERQGVEREVVCVGNGQLAQARLSPTVGTLNCMHDQQAVMTYQEHTETVDACIGKGTSNQLANNDMFVANALVVRRLTPLECERLQGFPDYWTDIGEWVDSKGKKHKDADSPRYKALGNSIALPFWQWMAKRMRRYLGDKPTMASLFSGIGGFEVVFQRSGVIPVWASEVEEFAIAVTKRRFPDGEMETSSNT